jgi:hypothetical protein
LNGGVDSYAPVLSLIQLKRDLEPLDADMVVLNLDVSDLVQETAYRRGALFGQGGEVMAVPQGEQRESLTERIRDWTDRHLFFTRAVFFYINELFGYRQIGTVRDVVTRANHETVAHTLADDTDPRDEQWRNIFDSVLRMRDYASGRGIEFLLSVYPWAHQVSDSEWLPGRYAFMSEDAIPSDRNRERVREFSTENGLELVDTFAAFRAAAGAEPLYFRHDMHWTAAGHEVMANGLKEYLSTRQLAPWCAADTTSP